MSSLSEVSNIYKLVEEVDKGANNLFKEDASQSSRRKLLASARALVTALESPADVLKRISWFEVGASSFLMTQITELSDLVNAMTAGTPDCNSHRYRLAALREVVGRRAFPQERRMACQSYWSRPSAPGYAATT